MIQYEAILFNNKLKETMHANLQIFTLFNLFFFSAERKEDFITSLSYLVWVLDKTIFRVCLCMGDKSPGRIKTAVYAKSSTRTILSGFHANVNII